MTRQTERPITTYPPFVAGCCAQKSSPHKREARFPKSGAVELNRSAGVVGQRAEPKPSHPPRDSEYNKVPISSSKSITSALYFLGPHLIIHRGSVSLVHPTTASITFARCQTVAFLLLGNLPTSLRITSPHPSANFSRSEADDPPTYNYSTLTLIDIGSSERQSLSYNYNNLPCLELCLCPRQPNPVL